MDNRQGLNKKWIVKSENKILGPFAIDQIEELLKKKQVSLIDEVRDTENRWLYIRECKALTRVVEAIRKDLETKEDHTKTIQTQSKSKTQTQTQTQSETLNQSEAQVNQLSESFDQEKVDVAGLNFENDESKMPKENLEIKNLKLKKEEILKKLEIDDFQNEIEIAFKETHVSKVSSSGSQTIVNQNSKASLNKFVLENDQVIKSEIKKNNNNYKLVIFGLMAFIFVSTAGYYFYQKDQEIKNSLKEITLIKKYHHFGLDEKVAQLYKSISNEQRDKVIPDILPQLPLLAQKGLLDLPEKIQQVRNNTQISSSKKALLDLIEFKLALKSGDELLAKDFLIKAKDLDPINPEIIENEAIFYYLTKNYKQATDTFRVLLNLDSKGRYLFGLAVSELNHLKESILFSQNLEDSTRERLLKLNIELEKYTTSRADFKNELLLAQFILLKILKSDKEAQIVFKKYLEMPTDFKSLFKTPLVIVDSFYSVDLLTSFLEKIVPSLAVSDRVLLQTHLLLENNKISEAQKYFLEFQNSIENKSDSQNLQLQIQFKLKNFSQMLAIEKSISFDNLKVASHLYLILAKRNLKQPSEQLQVHVKKLESERNAISMWSQLAIIDDIQAKIKFVDFNTTTIEDFIPFQEIRGQAE